MPAGPAVGAVLTVADTLSSLPALQLATSCPAVQPGASVELLAEYGAGGFGTVFSCRLPGAPGTAVVVKVFRDGAANTAVIADLHQALHGRGSSDWPLLVGVPYWAGTVRTPGGDITYAWIGQDLRHAGLEPLDHILEDPLRWQALLALRLEERVELAADLAEGYAALEQEQFVTADLSPDNVAVDLAGRRAVLLDVDSGALLSAGRAPLTAGKAGEFLAPELLNSAGVPDPARVSAASERWSVGFVLAHLLFGAHPLFFLRNTGHATLRAYAASHTWPELPAGSPLAAPANTAAYQQWRSEADQLPAAVQEAFAALVGPGVDTPAARPSAADWLAALCAPTGPPTFTVLSLQPTAVLLGASTQLVWEAPLGCNVHLEGDGDLPRQGSMTLFPTHSTTLRLRAGNRHGTVLHILPLAVFTVPARCSVTAIQRPVRPAPARVPVAVPVATFPSRPRMRPAAAVRPPARLARSVAQHWRC